MTSKQRFLSALRGADVDRVPVFPLLMFFAARRQGIAYRQFATSGHALAEAQLNIKENFPVDAITACSDAFRVSADLGGDIVLPEDKTPYLCRPLVCCEQDLARLRRPDVDAVGGRMRDRVQAVAEMARVAGEDCMVLGWVDMPFAEACSLCGVSDFMLMLYDAPGLAHAILEFLTGIVAEFAAAQIEAGAPMIGAGDAAASLISPALYREFALPYEKRIVDAVHRAGARVKLHICGNTTALLDDMLSADCDLYNVDHSVPLELAVQKYGKAGKACKGNLDPAADMLFSTPELCREKARACIRAARGTPYMLSPGCEVPADVSDEVFWAFCTANIPIQAEG